MNKLNILYVTSSTGRSGGVRQLLHNVNTVHTYGHNVYVCCPDNALLLHELHADIHIFFLPESRYLLIKKFAQIIKKYNIHIVHCFHGKLYKLFLLLKFFVPDFKLFLNRGVIFKPGSFPLLWLPQLNGIICNSFASANILQKYFVPKKKIHIVYNSVNISRYPKKQHEKFTITYIGNKRPYKGFDIFLKSIAYLFKLINSSKVNINVVGIAPNKLFKQFVNIEILSKINFLGGIEHTKVIDILSVTDVLAITSRQESMPNVLLEAYAMGVPVVATKVGGIPEVLKHDKNGFLCPVNDIKCIANIILKLYSRPELRAEIGQRNIMVAKKKFSMERKAERLITIYNNSFAN
jgi:glycosyltransferase involved in cell wall biosynthesis